MAALRFSDVQARPMELLDLTSLTRDEFQQLIPPFEATFQAHMRHGASMGNPGRRASLPCTRTAPCRHRKIGFCLFWYM
jgi:hypothetical protein